MPDLNSVPLSPHVLAASRSHSSTTQQTMSPSTTIDATRERRQSGAPLNAENILPSNQQAVHSQVDSTAVSSSAPSPQLPHAQPVHHQSHDAAVGSGPGPIRHPRPLTASELHMQLEKEQEAVVNRLTRELSLLRAAHNASVASNASSASATTSTHEPTADASLLSGAGFSIPGSRRHHRTSSTASQTHSIQLGSSFEGRPSRLEGASLRSSQSHIPPSVDPLSYFHQQRIPLSASSVAATPSVGDQLSPGLMPATVRYEETAHYRGELEAAKKENEALKKRVRELEKMMRDKSRDNSRVRPRSDSVSTTVSNSASVTGGGGSSIAGPREASQRERGRNPARQSIVSVGVGIPDEELNVGESAASAGLKNSS